ncbi:sigma factor [Clostridium sp.]|uniref:RNA polymerase sigma factor n=1 Tax=Clostridium sp. TaxID=1506 RepID=UPI003216891F
MEDIEVYYKSHGKKVYYYLLSMVHDDNLAEELTQETFYQAMKTINYLRISSDLSFAEIGEIIGKSENYARVTFNRGKKKLMEGELTK